MERPVTFTIITVTYNAADCLQRTLDSVLEQTHTDIEHLIIDGASADYTVRMAQEYAEKAAAKARRYSDRPTSRVVITSEKDGGLYDAMNKGLKAATGDYVIFMNAGDSFARKDTLEHVAKYARRSKDPPLPAVLYGDTDWTDDFGIVIGHRNHSAPKRLTWRSFKQGMLVCHQAFYVRTDIARQFPYDLSYRHSADIDWCIRVMKEAERQHLPLVNVREIVAHYQREGQTTENHRASLKERYDIMRKYYGTATTIAMHCWFVARKLLKAL